MKPQIIFGSIFFTIGHGFLWFDFDVFTSFIKEERNPKWHLYERRLQNIVKSLKRRQNSRYRTGKYTERPKCSYPKDHVKNMDLYELLLKKILIIVVYGKSLTSKCNERNTTFILLVLN